ncbi:MAG: nitroreductase family protein [Bacillota bacterium]|nr:nitroreductase family protein [Bacillota bacterium]
MEFYNVLENRVSVHKFKDSPVSKEALDRMVKAAMMSPSWKNNTSYKIILVQDKKKKDMVASSIINKTEEAAISIREAPIAAVIIGNPNKSGEIDNKDFYLIDSAIALEHFILAATDEGLGTCIIASFDEIKIKDALSIPKEFRVVAVTPIGEALEKKDHYEEKDIRQYVFMDNFSSSYNYYKNN